MAILRKAQCDICKTELYERGNGSGWPDWIIIQGVVLDGISNPMACSVCRTPIMNFVDDLKNNSTGEKQ